MSVFSWAKFVCVMLLVSATVATAASENPGTDTDDSVLVEYARYYEVLDAPVQLDADVVEFFAYTCSHCRMAESFVEAFKRVKPDSVSFEAYAVASPPMASQLTQYAFAAAKLAGVDDRIHASLYSRVHDDPRPFESKEDVRTFFREQGLLAEVDPLLESQESRQMRTRHLDAAHEVGIDRTPMFVVGGRYRVYWGSDQTPERFSALLLALVNASATDKERTASEHPSCSFEAEACAGPIVAPDL